MSERRTVQPVSEEIQQQNLADHAFMRKIKVQPSARPKISYRIQCFACNQEYYLDLAKKKTLTDDEIQTYLIANSWTVGTRGYECPACMQQWVNAVVKFVSRDHANAVEGTLERQNEAFEDREARP